MKGFCRSESAAADGAMSRFGGFLYFGRPGRARLREERMNYIEELQGYRPQNVQEEADRETILAYIRAFPDTVLTRENIFGHITASSMIFNEAGDKVLMIYHNIFRSWSWTGGHADGDTDMYRTALREAREETGIRTLARI